MKFWNVARRLAWSGALFVGALCLVHTASAQRVTLNFNPDWKFKQPLLDRNTDFRFYEEKNTCVYTTKQAINSEPILYVYHNDDGAWQFHTSLEPNLDDAMLVALEEITKLDPSINDIYHLQYGWWAWRGSKESAWQFAEDTVNNSE